MRTYGRGEAVMGAPCPIPMATCPSGENTDRLEQDWIQGNATKII